MHPKPIASIYLNLPFIGDGTEVVQMAVLTVDGTCVYRKEWQWDKDAAILEISTFVMRELTRQLMHCNRPQEGTRPLPF